MQIKMTDEHQAKLAIEGFTDLKIGNIFDAPFDCQENAYRISNFTSKKNKECK